MNKKPKIVKSAYTNKERLWIKLSQIYSTYDGAVDNKPTEKCIKHVDKVKICKKTMLILFIIIFIFKKQNSPHRCRVKLRSSIIITISILLIHFHYLYS